MVDQNVIIIVSALLAGLTFIAVVFPLLKKAEKSKVNVIYAGPFFNLSTVVAFTQVIGEMFTWQDRFRIIA